MAAREPAEEAEMLLVGSIEQWSRKTRTTLRWSKRMSLRCSVRTSCLFLRVYGAYLRRVSSRKGQRGAFAPRHAPSRIGYYYYTRGSHGGIPGLSTILPHLGDARACDRMPGARGSTNEPGHSHSMDQGYGVHVPLPFLLLSLVFTAMAAGPRGYRT